MKFIDDQIDIAAKAAIVEKPVISLRKYPYGPSIMTDFNNTVTFDNTADNIDSSIKSNIRAALDVDGKVYKLKVNRANAISQILEATCYSIMYFLRNYGGYTNNRQSKLYKWFKDNITVRMLHNNERLAQDLYNISKFIDGHKSDEQIAAARTLLNMIKDRYDKPSTTSKA